MASSTSGKSQISSTSSEFRSGSSKSKKIYLICSFNLIKIFLANLFKLITILVLMEVIRSSSSSSSTHQLVAGARVKGLIYNKDGKFIFKPPRSSQGHIIVIDDRSPRESSAKNETNNSQQRQQLADQTSPPLGNIQFTPTTPIAFDNNQLQLLHPAALRAANLYPSITASAPVGAQMRLISLNEIAGGNLAAATQSSQFAPQFLTTTDARNFQLIDRVPQSGANGYIQGGILPVMSFYGAAQQAQQHHSRLGNPNPLAYGPAPASNLIAGSQMNLAQAYDLQQVDQYPSGGEMQPIATLARPPTSQSPMVGLYHQRAVSGQSYEPDNHPSVLYDQPMAYDSPAQQQSHGQQVSTDVGALEEPPMTQPRERFYFQQSNTQPSYQQQHQHQHQQQAFGLARSQGPMNELDRFEDGEGEQMVDEYYESGRANNRFRPNVPNSFGNSRAPPPVHHSNHHHQQLTRSDGGLVGTSASFQSSTSGGGHHNSAPQSLANEQPAMAPPLAPPQPGDLYPADQDQHPPSAPTPSKPSPRMSSKKGNKQKMKRTKLTSGATASDSLEAPSVMKKDLVSSQYWKQFKDQFDM